MNFDDALRYLFGLGHETLAMKFGLENTETLLAALDSPERSFHAIQIAGTNGKGSVAAMLDAICCAAGIRTGLYTSPHLVSITERIKINGLDISPDDFARAVEQTSRAALIVREKHGALPTFFEHVTVAALVAFREAKVELAILETGLGGRLDATTAARAEVVAITPIDYDHQEYLGDTLAEIAAEKAAIIHSGASAVIAPQLPEARRVIDARCRALRAAPTRSARILKVEPVNSEPSTFDDKKTVSDKGRLRVTFKTARSVYKNVKLSLRGRHQAVNAAVAVSCAEVLRERFRFDSITRDATTRGLETAVHKGRLELIAPHDDSPAILFDGAHNGAGARALRAFLDEFFQDVPLTLVFGAMRDKDLQQIAAALFPTASLLILTRPDNARAAAPADLAALAAAHIDSNKIICADAPADALRIARERTPPEGLICITGSLYLVGEALALNDL